MAGELAMKVIGGVIVAVFTVVVIGFWRWTAMKVVQLELEIQELRQRMDDRDKTCNDRLSWNRQIEEKLNTVVSTTANIKGILETHMSYNNGRNSYDSRRNKRKGD